MVLDSYLPKAVITLRVKHLAFGSGVCGTQRCKALAARQRGSTNSSNNNVPPAATITRLYRTGRKASSRQHGQSRKRQSNPGKQQATSKQKERVRRVTTFPFGTLASG